MRKFLNRVTITGMDFVTPNALLSYSETYPFVEWGILFHPDRTGTSRYPNNSWLKLVNDLFMRNSGKFPMKFSAHLCGRYARSVCKGDWSFLKDFPYLDMFSRIQVNFAPYIQEVEKSEENMTAFMNGLEHPSLYFRQVIFQLNSRYKVSPIVEKCIREDFNICVLNDASGGKGISPENWNVPINDNVRQGFAGGLTPGNLKNQLDKLSTLNLRFNPWIDVETGIRTEHDLVSMPKLNDFLKISQDWVSPNCLRD